MLYYRYNIARNCLVFSYFAQFAAMRARYRPPPTHIYHGSFTSSKFFLIKKKRPFLPCPSSIRFSSEIAAISWYFVYGICAL